MGPTPAPWTTITGVSSMARYTAVAVSVPPGLPQMRSDPVRVRQILLQLVDNACKFTHRGTVRISAAAATKEGVAHLSVRISDTGIGISEEQQVKIFDPFYQADARAQEGTGLGLTLVRRLCETLGGELRMESVVGEGTTFEVLLPTTLTPHRLAPVSSDGGGPPRLPNPPSPPTQPPRGP